VAKYLAIEEILRRCHKVSVREEKQSLTKFIVIISTAIALEGLVLTIETSKENIKFSINGEHGKGCITIKSNDSDKKEE